LFGDEHYTAVLRVQAAVDVLTCYVIADLAMRVASERAARVAFLLGATCIFMANYAGTALTETLAIFATAAALDFAAMGFYALAVSQARKKRAAWLACGVALAFGILLRPDSGVLLAALLLYFGYRPLRISGRERRFAVAGLGLLTLVSLVPLVPWTLRNWRTFQRFEPLTPFLATDPSEPVPRGFIRWQKTWIVDYASTEDVWFRVPDELIDPNVLPARAFDSAEQQRRTEDLLARYNATGQLTPELDEEFGQLAKERIAAHRLRYYVVLPVARVLDMWLRPRTEMLPIDPHWWRWRLDPPQAVLSLGLAALNLFYVVAAALSFRRDQRIPLAGLFLLFFALRSILLAVMPAPEQRYTMECLPALLVLASAGLAGRKQTRVTEPAPSVAIGVHATESSP
jgi:4-amino-4-deoxy-L-arabinose transferase-like glycosyltransferase